MILIVMDDKLLALEILNAFSKLIQFSIYNVVYSHTPILIYLKLTTMYKPQNLIRAYKFLCLVKVPSRSLPWSGHL